MRKLGPQGFGFRNVQMHTGRKQDLLLVPFNHKAAHAQIAAKKFKHFTRLLSIYPECEYVSTSETVVVVVVVTVVLLVLVRWHWTLRAALMLSTRA